MGPIPIYVQRLRHSLQAPMGSIFIRQGTCVERVVRVYVSIMIREIIAMGMALIRKGNVIQEIWETLRCVKAQKRSLVTMI